MKLPSVFWRISTSLAASILIVAAVFWATLPSEPELLKKAQAALRQQRYADAQHLADRILWRRPDSPAALLLAAQACSKDQRFEDAVGYLDRLPSDDNPEVAQGHFVAADLHRNAGRLSAAERHLRQAVGALTDQAAAHRALANLLCLEERRWEAVPHLLALLQLRQYTPEELFLLCDLEHNFEDIEEIDRCLKAAPDDGHALLAKAVFEVKRNRPLDAERLLRKALAQHPQLLEAHARLGLLVIDDPAAFHEWRSALPPDATAHPKIWIVFAKWAAANQQPTAAIRCYWEALRLDSNYQSANFQLSVLLSSQGRESEAEPFRRRAEWIDELTRLGNSLWPHRKNVDGLKQKQAIDRSMRAAELCEELGRHWEAAAYYSMVVTFDPTATLARRRRDPLFRQLTSDAPRTLDAANPVKQIDLSSYPLPLWPAAPSGDRDRAAGHKATLPVSFQDRAQSAGIDFSYYNGHVPSENGMTLYQGLGGGVGVIDFDLDGWPDLYLTQGAHSPFEDQPDTNYADRLYRNLGDGTFQDVTKAAGLGDTSYSHGVAVGDYDNDGYADLYVANFGVNRFYRNNGDGTFSDVTAHAGLVHRDWTTSCALADLNGDGLPDIYDVNYVAATSAELVRNCSAGESRRRACPPHNYSAAQDRLYLNMGDGTFADRSQEAGILHPGGYGLGILVSSTDDSRGLSVVVANDTTANFWFVRTADADSDASSGPEVETGNLRFEERGLLSGLAFDENGKPQGCMGVAADDADGDGQLDLFITNFFDEANVLYLRKDRSFIDSARVAGLSGASVRMVGFGTQFLDAQLDGWPDLVVANGHIDDFTFQGDPFRMRPQFFANRGQGRFVPIEGDAAGPYFDRELLGRGLARVDWNRDGREDFVVSHLEQPVAIMSNETERTGHYLALQFRGVRSDRDAIGTIVQAAFGGKTLVRQLTAGDGYQASNQRQIVMGLGVESHVDELTIRWPSQATQLFRNVPADRQLLFIEGSDEYVRLDDSGQ